MSEESKAYTGAYSDRIKQLYELIAGREGFSYSPSNDPQYQAYKEGYEKQGRLAMRDAMAEAANLTGGYGSSYAQTVGNQAYGSYLEKLNAALPELYNAAYQRYVGEGDRLNQQLSAAVGLDNSEYQRYADERDWTLAEDKFDYQKESDAYDRLSDLISYAGYSPSEDELAMSGMSAQQAAALKTVYDEKQSKSGGGGYSSRGWNANRFTYKDYDPYAASSGGSSGSSGSSSSGGSTAGGKSEPSNKIVIKTHS